MSRIKVHQDVVGYSLTSRAGKFRAELKCGHKVLYICYVKTHPRRLLCKKCSIEEYVRQRDEGKEEKDAAV